MITRQQRLGLIGASAAFLLGVALLAANSRPGNLHFTGFAFLFVGLAVFALTLTSWLNERYQKSSLLATGLILAGVMFLIGLFFALWSYMY